MWDLLVKIVNYLLGGLIRLIWSWFTEFCNMMTVIVFGIIQTVMTSLNLDTTGQWSTEFLEKINIFFPVTETFGILGILFMNWLVILSIKVLLKLIPGVY